MILNNRLRREIWLISPVKVTFFRLRRNLIFSDWKMTDFFTNELYFLKYFNIPMRYELISSLMKVSSLMNLINFQKSLPYRSWTVLTQCLEKSNDMNFDTFLSDDKSAVTTFHFKQKCLVSPDGFGSIFDVLYPILKLRNRARWINRSLGSPLSRHFKCVIGANRSLGSPLSRHFKCVIGANRSLGSPLSRHFRAGLTIFIQVFFLDVLQVGALDLFYPGTLSLHFACIV